MDDAQILVRSPLGFSVRITHARWNKIVGIKHPNLAGLESEIQRTIETPDVIRRSRKAPNVYLCYCQAGERRWWCAVLRATNAEGFLVTDYLTDAIKEGEPLWSK